MEFLLQLGSGRRRAGAGNPSPPLSSCRTWRCQGLYKTQNKQQSVLRRAYQYGSPVLPSRGSWGASLTADFKDLWNQQLKDALRNTERFYF